MIHFEITMLQKSPSCSFIQEFMFKQKFALLKLNFVCYSTVLWPPYIPNESKWQNCFLEKEPMSTKKTRSKYSYKRADQRFPSLSLDNFIHVCNVIWSFSAPPLPTPLLPTLNPFLPIKSPSQIHVSFLSCLFRIWFSLTH